jgi:hypothetical protein
MVRGSTEERLATLESNMENHRRETNEKYDSLKHDIGDLQDSVDRFGALLNQAKGARILLSIIAILLGWLGGLGDLIKHLFK